MAAMNRFERWMVNRRTEARARRVLAAVGPHVPASAASQVLELGQDAADSSR